MEKLLFYCKISFAILPETMQQDSIHTQADTYRVAILQKRMLKLA